MTKGKSKLLALIMMSTLAMATLAGCTGDSGGSSVNSMDNGSSYEAFDSDFNTGSSDSISIDGSSGLDVSDYSGLRTYSGDLSLDSKTKNFMDSYNSVHDTVTKYEGFMESDSISNSSYYAADDDYRVAYMTVRVPSDKFSTMISEIANMDTVAILSQDISMNDITVDYNNVKDSVESDSSYNSEWDMAKLQQYELDLKYSSVDITLREVSDKTMAEHNKDYAGRFSATFVEGWENGTAFLSEVLLLLVGNWFIIAVVVIAVLVYRRLTKEKRQARKLEMKRRAAENDAVRKILIDGASNMDAKPTVGPDVKLNIEQVSQVDEQIESDTSADK